MRDDSGPAYTIASRHNPAGRVDEQVPTPGPGEYITGGPQGSAAPAWTMGTRPVERDPDMVRGAVILFSK